MNCAGNCHILEQSQWKIGLSRRAAQELMGGSFLAWKVKLRYAAQTLDTDKVIEAASYTIDAFSAQFSMLGGGFPSEERSLQEYAFNHMKEYVTITHEVVAQTLLSGKQHAAAACVVILVDCMRALGDELVKRVFWDDADIDDTFFPTFPVGDTNSALMCYLAQMSVWHGTCRRGATMMEEISKSKPLHRALERCALTFSALHELNYSAQTNCERWHILAKDSLIQNCSSKTDMDEEGGGFDCDPTVMLRGISNPTPHTIDCEGMSLHPVAHSMFQNMYSARKMMQELVDEVVAEEMIEVCTMRAARVFIKLQKEIYYKSLWHRWFLLWRTISRWTKATGEDQGAIDGRIGAAGLAEYDADMGGMW